MGKKKTKILGGKYYDNYYVRFVILDSGASLSRMTTKINKTPFTIRPQFSKIYYLGFIIYDDLLNFPKIPKGGAYNLILKLPNFVVNDMKIDVQEYLESNNLTNHTTLSLLIYEER